MRRKPLPPPPRNADGRLLRNKGRQKTSRLTVNGRIVHLRLRWHDPREGSVAPVDVWLDDGEASVSRAVRELACRAAASATSFVRAADLLKHAAGLEISGESLRKLVEAEGRRVVELQAQGGLIPEWSTEDCKVDSTSPTRLYAGCDGFFVRTATDEEKRRRRAKAVRKRGERRRSRRRRGEPAAERPLPPRRPGADQPFKEFRILHLYDEGSKRRWVETVQADPGECGRRLRRMAGIVRMEEADETIGLIDGAPWIRAQFEFHELTAALGLDWFHLREHVRAAWRAAGGADPADLPSTPQGGGPSRGRRGLEDSHVGRLEGWAGETLRRFYEEDVDSGLAKLREVESGLTGAARAAVSSLIGYVEERRSMIRFAEFRRRGWSIGNGPTESQCKTMKQRLSGRGRRWDAAHALEMTALASLESSGLWDAYWATQLAA